ncbi:MAG: antibiotic biosynthesis monooxygenase [Burkholderiales bacterium]|nr:antibiotic biosynthesis monooxygenase [Burkholderiales bacterium]
MIAVIFEVCIADGKQEQYLAFAQTLREQLVQIDGFISIERFQSLSQPDKLLSLSYWRDEQAVQTWRNMEQHRQAQTAGRASIFSDYCICVGDIVRRYTMQERNQVPLDSQQALG